MLLMGHSSARMATNYEHGMPRVIQNAADRLVEKRSEVVKFIREVG